MPRSLPGVEAAASTTHSGLGVDEPRGCSLQGDGGDLLVGDLDRQQMRAVFLANLKHRRFTEPVHFRGKKLLTIRHVLRPSIFSPRDVKPGSNAKRHPDVCRSEALISSAADIDVTGKNDRGKGAGA